MMLRTIDRRYRQPTRKNYKCIGYNVPDIKIQKVASLAQKLFILQPSGHEDGASVSQVRVDVGGANSNEFGSELVFRAPSRFLVDESLKNELLLEEEISVLSSLPGEQYNHIESLPNQFVVDKGKVDLRWLRDECDRIVRQSGSQPSSDDLAMALCHVLDSDRAGDEIAGELLDLVGDGAFETVQDLLKHRKELVEAIRHGIVVLKSEKAPSSQPRMPSYGTQVTIQTETEKQIDKLRRKEEKRQRRGTEHGVENDLSAGNFSSLLQASESKGLFDDLISSGQGSSSFGVSSLPQGSTRKNSKGYEEVSIPATPTAQMKPGEKLIEIKELDDFAQAAFHGYKSLNRIQSRIYQATYHTNENILVCAPTGAGKTNIAMIAVLHEAHFSQLEMPISDYVTDLKSVLDQSIRIMQAMIDICANSGWLSSTIICMHLLQMVMQGLWFERDSSLLMLPSMNSELVTLLGKRGISNVQQLLILPKATLQSFIENFPVAQLYQDFLTDQNMHEADDHISN